nr:5670_t:CDS:2 [Entrophospora candida]
MKIEMELLAEKSTSHQRSFFNTDDIEGDNDLCDDSVIGNNVSESGGDNSVECCV